MEVILQKSTNPKGSLMAKAKLSPSILPSKKYTAIIGKKSIHFGAAGYEDYTIHKDDKRKELYIKRHEK